MVVVAWWPPLSLSTPGYERITIVENQYQCRNPFCPLAARLLNLSFPTFYNCGRTSSLWNKKYQHNNCGPTLFFSTVGCSDQLTRTPTNLVSDSIKDRSFIMGLKNSHAKNYFLATWPEESNSSQLCGEQTHQLTRIPLVVAGPPLLKQNKTKQAPHHTPIEQKYKKDESSMFCTRTFIHAQNKTTVIRRKCSSSSLEYPITYARKIVCPQSMGVDALISRNNLPPPSSL